MLAQVIAWAPSTGIEVASQLLKGYAERLLARPALDRAINRETAAAA
jgi:hypothetical protein